MKGRKAAKSSMVKVPQTLEEAAETIRQIGVAQREIKSIKTNFNEKVEASKRKAMDKVKPYEEDISRLVGVLFAYAESHRDELTDKGKRKTVPLPTGEFKWRLTPAALSLENEDKTVEELKNLGFENLIRVIEEVDKKETLKELQREESELAEKLEGVSIKQHELFIIKPAELKLEIKKDVETLKRAIV